MNKTLILPNHKEIVYGRRYLLFQLVFLGSALSLFTSLLGIQLDAAGLNLLYFAVNFTVCTVMLRAFLKQSLLFGLKELRRCAIAATIGFAAYEAVMSILGLVIIAIDPTFANVNDQAIAAMGQNNYVFMVIGTVVLVPLAEECLHRGIVFGGLYRRNRIAAYIVSTIVFSLIHISGYFGSTAPLKLLLCFIQYVPAGVCLAAAYEYSGSILTPILIHTAVNALGMMAMR